MRHSGFASNTPPKPRLPKGLKTFVDCEVGFPRAGALRGYETHDQYEKLVKTGQLQRVANPEDKPSEYHQWYALTEKGKAIVKRVEDWFNRYFG